MPEEASNLAINYLFNKGYFQCDFAEYQQLYQQIEFPIVFTYCHPRPHFLTLKHILQTMPFAGWKLRHRNPPVTPTIFLDKQLKMKPNYLLDYSFPSI